MDVLKKDGETKNEQISIVPCRIYRKGHETFPMSLARTMHYICFIFHDQQTSLLQLP